MPHFAVVDGRVRRPRRTTAYLLGSVIAVLAAPTAHAATPPTGGAVARPAPSIVSLECRTECATPAAGHAGSRVRVRGKRLRRVDSVVFQGAPGGADDVSVSPLRTGRRYADARVPRTAVAGPVKVITRDGTESAPTAAPLGIDPNMPATLPSSGNGLAIDVEIQGNRVFEGSERQAQVSYVVRDSQAANVTVELVRLSDNVAVTSWPATVVQPNVPQTVAWDGTAGGKVQRDGRYAFRVSATSQSGVTASSAQAAAPVPAAKVPGSFMFQRNIFPIRGRHTYGTGAAAFGGGRGHQGQDVFAKCGTPLVAARAGVVKFKRFQSAAGNYIVIDGDGTGYDYAYMHLRDAALVDEGDHVYTGQPIGFVGDTGRASGCHLHIELWKAPGWYSGGSPVDPLPILQAWDKRS